MRNLATLIFLFGLAFLLLVLTGFLPFGNPPMLIGDVIRNGSVEATGSANVVTSVVLAYRGIDTLGELSILFAAATAGSLVLGNGRGAATGNDGDAGFILRAGSDLMFPLLLVVGLYIVAHGHITPGGGFQGGVIIAAAFFLPSLVRPAEILSSNTMAWVEGISGSAFILIGIAAIWQGGEFLQPLLDKGQAGELVSAGTLPLLYIAVGMKVGAELAGLLSKLAQRGEETV